MIIKNVPEILKGFVTDTGELNESLITQHIPQVLLAKGETPKSIFFTIASSLAQSKEFISAHFEDMMLDTTLAASDIHIDVVVEHIEYISKTIAFELVDQFQQSHGSPPVYIMNKIMEIPGFNADVAPLLVTHIISNIKSHNLDSDPATKQASGEFINDFFYETNIIAHMVQTDAWKLTLEHPSYFSPLDTLAAHFDTLDEFRDAPDYIAAMTLVSQAQLHSACATWLHKAADTDDIEMVNLFEAIVTEIKSWIN